MHHKVESTSHPARERATSHQTAHNHLPPPPRRCRRRKQCPSASHPQTRTTNSMQYAPGHMPVPDFEALARNIQNRASHCVSAATMETRHFREFFGMSVLVIEKTWELLERDSLLPEGGRLKHLLWDLHFLLWDLHFMKVYPKQSWGVRPSARLPEPATRRPTASGSGHLSTPLPTWTTLW